MAGAEGRYYTRSGLAADVAGGAGTGEYRRSRRGKARDRATGRSDAWPNLVAERAVGADRIRRLRRDLVRRFAATRPAHLVLPRRMAVAYTRLEPSQRILPTVESALAHGAIDHFSGALLGFWPELSPVSGRDYRGAPHARRAPTVGHAPCRRQSVVQHDRGGDTRALRAGSRRHFAGDSNESRRLSRFRCRALVVRGSRRPVFTPRRGGPGARNAWSHDVRHRHRDGRDRRNRGADPPRLEDGTRPHRSARDHQLGLVLRRTKRYEGAVPLDQAVQLHLDLERHRRTGRVRSARPVDIRCNRPRGDARRRTSPRLGAADPGRVQEAGRGPARAADRRARHVRARQRAALLASRRGEFPAISCTSRPCSRCRRSRLP